MPSGSMMWECAMKRLLSLGAAAIALSLATGTQAAAVYLGTYLNGNDSQTLMRTLTGNPTLEYFAKLNAPASPDSGAVSAGLFTVSGINPASAGGLWSYAGFSSGGFDYTVTHFVVKAGNDFAVYKMDPTSAAYVNIPWSTERLFVGNPGRMAYCYGEGAQGTVLLNPGANGAYTPSDANKCNGFFPANPNPSVTNPTISHLAWYGVRLIPSTPVSEPATLALFGAGLLGLAALRRRAAR
jgi:hypothetical protein